MKHIVEITSTGYDYLGVASNFNMMIRFKLFAILLIGLTEGVFGQDTTFCNYENDSLILTCGCIIGFTCFIDYEHSNDTIKDCYSDYVISLFEKYSVEKIEISFNASSHKSRDNEKKYTDNLANKCRNELLKHDLDTSRVKVFSNGDSKPIIVSYEVHKRYRFLPVGVKLDHDFIETLKSEEEKLVARMFNERADIKIIEMKNSR